MNASEKGKEKEKEDENGGGSRKIFIFELDVSERTENDEDSDEEMDTNFLGIECSFYPKKKKRLKTVGVQYSMEELCSAFHSSSVGRTEVTQQLQHNNRYYFSSTAFVQLIKQKCRIAFLNLFSIILLIGKKSRARKIPLILKSCRCKKRRIKMT